MLMALRAENLSLWEMNAIFPNILRGEVWRRGGEEEGEREEDEREKEEVVEF